MTIDPELAEFIEFVAFATGRPLTMAAAPAPVAPQPDPQPGPAPEQVALGGQDGDKAEQLLEAAKQDGIAVISSITRQALARWLDVGASTLLHADRLYNDDERQQLADALAATTATANLLGRSRIRLRQQRAEAAQGAAKFSDPTDFSAFADGIKPLPPERALEYFKGLVTNLGVTSPARFGQAMERDAFTLARTTDAAILDRIKDAIAAVLETGQEVRATPRRIKEILDTAGASPNNPQYAEMVMRTNMKDAYNVGADQERQDPDVIETFPVWRYIGIADGRQRPQHAAHFDRYFPADVSFAAVRDSLFNGEFSGFNCRCDQVPIDKWEWSRLVAAGARIAPGYKQVPAMRLESAGAGVGVQAA